MSKRQVLRFGIQSLDRLIGTVELDDGRKIYGIDVSEPEKSPDDEESESQSTGSNKIDLPIISSVCLAGPDGTGKSVLSLHLASQYLTDCLANDSSGSCQHLKVLYISTDLTYKMALKGWNHFALNQPFKRSEPLVELREGRREEKKEEFEISLEQYFPSSGAKSSQSITHYLESYSCLRNDKKFKPQVCFVDLASRTAGDDWGFVHRLLSTLDEPDNLAPRHLVILDAVEGFETLVGDLNAFGEESSRRSRIAQVMRLAAGRCHLLLVVEESHHQRFPEEFVTDVVIRLRNAQTGRYVRRTVEIEKARGQWHGRGQHPYVIRNGHGSTTGIQQINADDPEVFRNKDQKKYQGYVHVFPSLDYTSREIMIDRNNPLQIPEQTRFAAFGIPYLDNMLGGSSDAESDSEGKFDRRGLPCSSATALIGDSMTQKSQLGKAFLSRAFYQFMGDLKKGIDKVSDTLLGAEVIKKVEEGIRQIAHETPNATATALATSIINELNEHVQEIADELSRQNSFYPVVVLFTTQDVTVEALVTDFYQWLRHQDNLAIEDTVNLTSQERVKRVEERIQGFANWYHHLFIKRRNERLSKGDHYQKERLSKGSHYQKEQNQLKLELVEIAVENTMLAHMTKRTICRRFEIHDLPGPVLMNIFQCGIQRAQQILHGTEGKKLPEPKDRFKESWRIRVMVDDLNGFRNTYPDVQEDPLMLPSLLFKFGREGVTSLIVDTQESGSPELAITERFDTSLRELVQTRIYIWRLPFYGENRVALSVIPPMSHEYRGLIRELRWDMKGESRTDRALSVDPHFELYTGLERGQPQPVPLEVRLYSDTPSVERYITMEEKLLSEIFTPVVKHNQEPRVITPARAHEYELLRDACHLQRDTKLDHTTIVQVNEFWWLSHPRQRGAGAFRPQWNYLNSATATLRGDECFSDCVVDPFLVFQPSPSSQEEAKKAQTTGGQASVKRKHHFFNEDCGYSYDRVGTEEKRHIDRVPYTWDFGFLLCNGRAWGEALEMDMVKNKQAVINVWNKLCQATRNGSSQMVSWRDFLQASKFVAEFQSYRSSTKATAFDFTMLIPESFSCLMLEMWLSEAYDTLKRYEATDPTVPERLARLRGVGTRQWSSAKEDSVTLLRGLIKEKGKPLECILNERRTNGKITNYSLELYKVWLLLTEVVNFAELVDSSSHLNFEFKSRDVLPNAVSARHWYKSASNFIDSLTSEQVEYNWMPVRLPGHFSVRADWFLAVVGGSRSSRLADHALDLLSSQRSNVTRLQEGIGLPTRRLFNDQRSRLRTRLISAARGEPLRNIEYDELRKIGAQENEEDFLWLWRSRMWAYNRHSRIWHKWLNRALLWWHSFHQRHDSNWKNGFAVYDLLTAIEFPSDNKEFEEKLAEFQSQELDSWKEFGNLRDILISELQQVSVSTM